MCKPVNASKNTYRDIVYPPGWSMLPRVVALDFQTLVIVHQNRSPGFLECKKIQIAGYLVHYKRPKTERNRNVNALELE